jgi:hypothetical protein
MPSYIILAIALALGGAFACYAGGHHQRLTNSGSGRPSWRVGGAAMLAVALVLMVGWFGPATAVFAWMTFAMLIWSIAPLVAAWLRHPRSKAE